MNIPESLRYSDTHEWARLEGDEVVVGITDFAQSELGDIVYVQVGKVGTAVEAHSPFGTVESVKTSSELFAPVSGTITAVNSDLSAHPEWINQDPYEKGWMVRIKITKPDQFASLMTAEQYKGFIAGK
ncbi:MAG: glycine cleavage system protein GcvH [bacterium JZ-2024 1]